MSSALGVTGGLLGLFLLAACSTDGAERQRTPLEPSGGTDGGLVGAGGNIAGNGGANSGGGHPIRVPFDKDGSSPDTGAGGTGNEPDASPRPDASIDCSEGLVWKSTSARVAISSFGFWEGSMRYEKDAADLSGAQISALRNLCLIPSPKTVGADFTSYRVVVTDTDGTTATFRAVDGDIGDSDEGNINGIRSISFESLSKFLATFDCRTAKGGGPPGAAADGGVSDVESLPALSPDPGCYDGVFFSYDPGKQDLKVPVVSPGTLKIEAIDCYQAIGLRLLQPVTGKELANSGLKTAPMCPSIELHIDTAGSYVLEVEKMNDSSSHSPTAGDFYLRMSLTP